jgi:tetratricopeptide (TPR) repeat protein
MNNDLSQIDMLMKKGKYLNAKKALELIIKSSPNFPIAHQKLAQVFLSLEDNANAWDEANISLEMEPSAPLPKIVKCNVLINKEDYKQAEQMIKEIIDVYPTVAIAYNTLGIVYLKTDRPQESIIEFEKAQELDPSFWASRYNMSIALQKCKQNKKALAKAIEAYKISPNSKTLTGILLQLNSSYPRIRFLLLLIITILLGIISNRIPIIMMGIFAILLIFSLFLLIKRRKSYIGRLLLFVSLAGLLIGGSSYLTIINN